MVLHCCVPNCTSKKGDSSISFHVFPAKTKVRKAWMAKLRVRKVVKTMCVCSKHFATDDFLQLEGYMYIKRRLKITAIPSINLPAPSFSRSRNEKLDTDRLLRQLRREQHQTSLQKVHRGMQVTPSQMETMDTDRQLHEQRREQQKSCTLENVHHRMQVLPSDTQIIPDAEIDSGDAPSQNTDDIVAKLTLALSDKDEVITALKNTLSNFEKAFVEMTTTFEELRNLKIVMKKKDEQIANLQASLSVLQLKHESTVLEKQTIAAEYLKLDQLHAKGTKNRKRVFSMKAWRKDDRC